MFNILTILLIVILIYEILVLHRTIKWGDQYWISFTLSLNEFSKGLGVLERASVGSYFSFTLRKGSPQIIALKNQDSSEWWFELLINPKKKRYFFDKAKNHISSIYYKDILGALLNEYGFEDKTKKPIPLSCRKSLHKYNRFVVDNDKEKIADVLITFFQKNFKSSSTDKITISFNNTYVEHGIIQ